MSFEIEVQGGSSVRLPTAGKYCDRDIVVTATGADTYSAARSLLTNTCTEYCDDELTSIASYAFYKLTALEKVWLESATVIGSYAFSGCSALVDVRLPKVQNLNTYVFQLCRKLKYVDLPACGLINANAFHSCSALKVIVLRDIKYGCVLSNKNALQGTPFYTNGTGGYLLAPRYWVSSYEQDTNWSALTCDVLAVEDYTLDGTITGELDMTKIEELIG